MKELVENRGASPNGERCTGSLYISTHLNPALSAIKLARSAQHFAGSYIVNPAQRCPDDFDPRRTSKWALKNPLWGGTSAMSPLWTAAAYVFLLLILSFTLVCLFPLAFVRALTLSQTANQLSAKFTASVLCSHQSIRSQRSSVPSYGQIRSARDCPVPPGAWRDTAPTAAVRPRGQP